MTRCLTATLSILTLMILTSSVHADVKGKVQDMQSPADSKQFAMKAAEGNMLEIKLAQLAQQKSQSQEVKQLAQKLEQDHTRAGQELKQVAQQKNINIPDDIQNPECKEVLEAFQQLEGKDFDNAFVLHNIKDHLKEIAMFQKEAQNGSDQEIKQWATKTLPVLQMHAQHIRPVATAMGLPVDALAGMGGATDAARTAGSRIQGSGTSGSGSSSGTSGSGSSSGSGTGGTGTRGGSSGGGSSGSGGTGTSGGSSSGGGTSGGGTNR